MNSENLQKFCILLFMHFTPKKKQHKMGFKLYASKLCTREEVVNHIYTDLSLLMPTFFINLYA